jgi:hypothetical protein
MVERFRIPGLRNIVRRYEMFIVMIINTSAIKIRKAYSLGCFYCSKFHTTTPTINRSNTLRNSKTYKLLLDSWEYRNAGTPFPA